MPEPAPERPQRKRLRLPGFDYGKGHAFFITLCTHERTRLFSEIVSERVMLNPAGEMLAHVWEGMPGIVQGMLLDEYIVMPDHCHAIFALIDPHDRPGHSPAPTAATPRFAARRRGCPAPPCPR
jgi:putative transposase